MKRQFLAGLCGTMRQRWLVDCLWLCEYRSRMRCVVEHRWCWSLPICQSSTMRSSVSEALSCVVTCRSSQPVDSTPATAITTVCQFVLSLQRLSFSLSLVTTLPPSVLRSCVPGWRFGCFTKLPTVYIPTTELTLRIFDCFFGFFIVISVFFSLF